MQQIKAIPTRYKGYHFRSRLEARWAVFFDALGIEYQYEPQGFESKSGSKYLPDFYLPSSGTWVEVKGGQVSDADAIKMLSVLPDMPGVLHFERLADIPHACIEFAKPSKQCMSCLGLLILGDIPNCNNFYGSVFHSMIEMRGLFPKPVRARFWWDCIYGHIAPETLGYAVESFFDELDGKKDPRSALHIGWRTTPWELSQDAESYRRALFDSTPRFIATKDDFAAHILDAYAAARSARFEHGHSGAS